MHIVTWSFLTGYHQGINKGFMHYTLVYACHQETCYNFRLLTRTDLNQKTKLLLIDQQCQ